MRHLRSSPSALGALLQHGAGPGIEPAGSRARSERVTAPRFLPRDRAREAEPRHGAPPGGYVGRPVAGAERVPAGRGLRADVPRVHARRSRLAPVRTAIHAILTQQEPYPAVVMNRRWDIVATNGAASRFFGMLLGDRTPPGAGNVLRLMFHPDGLRPFVENWEAVAQALVRRVHREAHWWGARRGGTAALVGESSPILAFRPDGGRPTSVRQWFPWCRSAFGAAAGVSFLLCGHGAGHAAGHHAAGTAHRVLLPAGRRERRRSAESRSSNQSPVLFSSSSG